MAIIIIYKKTASDDFALAYREKNLYDSRV
jgi:hypothetical protein